MESGSFSLIGSSVSFNPMYADKGTFELTGYPATHAYAGAYAIMPGEIGLDIKFVVEPSSFEWVGFPATHAYPGSYKINDIYWWTDSDTILGVRFASSSGAFSLLGTEVTFNRISPWAGSYVLNGELDFRVGFRAAPAGELVYLCVLTGSPDLEIGINSFQAIKKKDKPTFLQVVIPGVDQEFEIYSRSNGQLKIDMGYRIGDEITNRKTIIQADLEDITVYNGANRKTITLLAYSTSVQTNNTINIAHPVYKSTLNGIIRYRFASPNLYVEPGDRLIIGNDTFTANSITYFFGPKYATMEIAEEQ